MENKKKILQTVINKHFREAGEIIEWDRCINPPSEILFANQNRFKLIISDSAIEDNHIYDILDKVSKFAKQIQEFNGHWILDSKLNINPDRS